MEAMNEALTMVLEDCDDTMEIAMIEGEWLREEESLDLVESLVKVEAYLKDASTSENIIKNTQIQDKDNSKKVLAPEVEGEKKDDNTMLAVSVENSGSDYNWWEVFAETHGGGDLSDYNWFYEDDMKIWDLTAYPCSISEFSRSFQMSYFTKDTTSSGP